VDKLNFEVEQRNMEYDIQKELLKTKEKEVTQLTSLAKVGEPKLKSLKERQNKVEDLAKGIRVEEEIWREAKKRATQRVFNAY